jgi:hypothetical protein
MESRGLKEVTRLRNVCGGYLIRRANDAKFQMSNLHVFRRPGDKINTRTINIPLILLLRYRTNQNLQLLGMEFFDFPNRHHIFIPMYD